MNWIKKFYIKSEEFASSLKKQRQMCWLITLILVMFSIYRFVFFEPINQFVIASISSFHGFYTQGGALEVGRSSTKAVVYSSVVIIVLNYILTQLLLN